MFQFFRKKKKPQSESLKDSIEKEPLPKTVGEVSDDSVPAEKRTPWIGVDLDGTLAESTTWRGFEHIGKPVPVMLARVQFWIEKGYNVKIFTARASSPEKGIPPVKKWLEENGLPELEITNQKDFDMIELWDDRAIQVVCNTGRPFLSQSAIGRPSAPILPNEDGDSTFYLLKRKSVPAENPNVPVEKKNKRENT